VGRDTAGTPYQISRVRPKAERYIRSLTPKMRQRVDEAFQKICDNPFWDEHPLHIRRLKGELEGLFEYRGIYSLRIIYEVFEEKHEIEVLKVIQHL